MSMRNYTKIPNEIFEPSQLSIKSRYLYCVLLKFCGRDDHCFPGQKKLAEILGCSERQIRYLIDELEKSEILLKRRSGWNRTNTYTLTKDLTSNRKPTSAPLRNFISHQLGPVIPLHQGIPLPPKSTYLKGKDKRSLKGLEKMRKDLVTKGILKPTTIVIKPNLNEYRRHLKVANKFPY